VPPKATPPAAEDSRGIARLRLLLFDSSPAAAQQVRTAFETARVPVDVIRVDTLADLETALREFKFEAVIGRDFVAGVDGFAVIHEVRQQSAQLPVLLLTAKANPKFSEDALAHGANAVIAEPDLPELPTIARQAVRQARETFGRQRAELALTESEMRFQQIADNLHQGFWMTGIDDGRLLMVNPAFEEITGRNSEWLTGENRHLLDLVHPDDREHVARILDLEARHREFQVECRLQRPDGSLRWTWNRGFPVRDSRGNASHVVGIVEDITARKLAAENFQRDSERLASMLQALPDTYLLLNRNGRVLDCHLGDDHCIFSGVKNPAGKTLEELLTRDIATSLLSSIDRAAEKQSLVTTEFATHCSDGESFYEARISPLANDQFFAFLRNVTDRRRGEAELQRNQDRLSTLIDSLPGIVFTCNYVGEWAVTYLSEGFQEITGYLPNEIKGNQHPSLAPLMPPEDAERTARELQSALADRRPYVIEFCIHTKNGERRWLWEQGRGLYNEAGELIGREGFIADITSRKLAENALQESEALYHSLVDNLPLPIFQKDASGRIVFANDSLCQLLGKSPAEIIGKTDYDLVPKSEADIYTASDREVMATGKVFEKEETQWTPDGRECRMRVIKIPLRDTTGKPIGVQGALVDVTEQQLAAAKLSESNARLESALEQIKANQSQVVQQERLKALSEMARGVAHDFNNALMTIQGFSELLLARPEQIADPARVADYLQTIHSAAKEAGTVVKRLSEFFRKRDRGESLPIVDLHQLIEKVVAEIEPRRKAQSDESGRPIALFSDLQELPPVNGDAEALHECLGNLMINSIEAMPEGGALMVSSWSAHGRVYVEVSDTGVGMSEEVRQKCMEPFFTTKAAHGSGLGLAMVFGIVERHGGTIEISSELTKGTRVTVSFPVATEAGPGNDTTFFRAAPAKPMRILVVDDEPLILEILAEYLATDGHQVVTALTGSAALEQFDPEAFDLVLTDKAMPQMSGDHLASEIKQRSPNTPVIMVTGFGDILNATGDKPQHVDKVLAKPLSLASLQKAICEMAGN
jgi:PAS domain S-box-containing protein